MTHRISIPLETLLREAEAQTSVDFQGLRAANALSDLVYDDFTMCADNAPEATGQVRIASALLCSRYANCIREETCSPEVLVYLTNPTSRRSDCGHIRVFLMEYLKQSLLVWWYMSRNAMMTSAAVAAAEDALNRLAGQLQASTAVRKSRWF